MGQIVVNKQSGEALLLQRKKPLTTVTDAKQSRNLLDRDLVTMTVECVEPITFDIGDTIAVFGEIYTLNRLPKASRNRANFVYDLTFEGSQYGLMRVTFFNLDVTGFSTGSEFSLTGDLDMFAGVLMNNIHRAFPDWTLGEVQAGTPVKTLTFTNMNCLAALQTLCKEFGTEFDLVRMTETSCAVHFHKVGNLLGQTFQYGRAKGLYSLSRDNVGEKDFITRLYPFGSTKNIPSGYRNNSTRLRLVTEKNYLENELALLAFGLYEGVMVFEDVYPHRTGTIASVGSTGLSFVDPGMDFDLNAFLQPGITAKVSVQTGALAGRGFEVAFYVHATKTFTIIPFKDDQNMEFPSATVFVLAPGDTYVLLDIIMPPSYVESAELALKNAAQAYLDANCAPRVQYSLEIAETYLRSRDTAGSVTNFFSLGDIVQIVDADLNIDKASRVLSMERDILLPYRYSLIIADSYEVTLIDRILNNQVEIKNIIRVNGLQDSKRALLGWKIGQELLGLFFDTDGQFDGSKIRPETIEAGSLSIGAKSQQLILNVIIEPNYNGLANSMRVNAGNLTHYTIDDSGPKSWVLGAQVTSLTDNNTRYIYAKCHKTNNNDALISFDTVQRKVDSDATYYYFLIGYLHTVIDGVRFISLTYGATTINGRFIRTGRIQSADGSTYFDLDTGEIGGRIIFAGNGGGDTSLATLEAEFTYFQNVTVPNLRRSLTGRIVSYFAEVDPNTWAEYDRVNHDGDQWYKPSTKQLFSYSKTSNSWTENTDKTAVAAYEKASQAKDTADGKRRNFIVQPFVPYDIGDLWTDGIDLRRCITAKGAAQVYSGLDWEKATVYDNTKVVIDNGVVTAGSVLLSNVAGFVRAGITGLAGILLSSPVRFFAGASIENREYAPFRVTDNGEVFARKRIEMLNENNVGQAGISGANTSEDGLTRFWAGATYELRNSAPFQVFADGAVKMLKGLIGKLTISDGGLIAQDGLSAVQININRPDPNAATDLVNMRSASYTSNANVINNVALDLDAVNTADRTTNGGINPHSYALRARNGKVMASEGLLNGRAHQHYVSAVSGNKSITIDATLVDSVSSFPTSGRLDFTIGAIDVASSVKNGKQLVFMNLNDAYSDCFLMNVIYGTPEYRLSGGVACTLFWLYGHWHVLNTYDNNWPAGAIAGIPTNDQL